MQKHSQNYTNFNLQLCSDVKSSRPKWPRSQNFVLGLKDLASALKLWPQPRPQTFGLGLASISLS